LPAAATSSTSVARARCLPSEEKSGHVQVLLVPQADMKNLDLWHMLGIAGAILLLTLAVLAIRFGHVRYAYKDGE